VRNIVSIVLAVALLSVSAFAWTQARQGQPAPPQTTSQAAKAPTSVDDTLRAVRSDLQGERADIIAKNVTLTAEQAAKFWPVFQQYQEEQNAIMDAQLKGIQQYVDNYERLDDAGALALITAHFDRDTRMNALRQKWLGEFQKVLPVKTAVRVIQIDRRLSLAHQMEFSALIPLVH
jgi:Spy/CpxP family protein refolding chaperone